MDQEIFCGIGFFLFLSGMSSYNHKDARNFSLCSRTLFACNLLIRDTTPPPKALVVFCKFFLERGKIKMGIKRGRQQFPKALQFSILCSSAPPNLFFGWNFDFTYKQLMNLSKAELPVVSSMFASFHMVSFSVWSGWLGYPGAGRIPSYLILRRPERSSCSLLL